MRSRMVLKNVYILFTGSHEGGHHRVAQVLLLIFTLFFAGCAPHAVLQYKKAPYSRIIGKKSAIVPLRAVTTKYIDNTRSTPEPLHNDTFLTRAAEEFIRFGAGKELRVLAVADSLFGITTTTPLPRFSYLAGDTVDSLTAGERIRAIASDTKAEIVVVPYACTITHKTIQPQGWRDDKYEGSYAKPVKFTALAETHIQIWDSSGTLLLERRGRARMGRPLLYSFFQKQRDRYEEGDILSGVTKLYASPILKALYKSIIVSFQLSDDSVFIIDVDKQKSDFR